MAKQSKNVFGIPKVENCGYFISCDSVSTDPRKIKVVQHLPTLGNLKQHRGFLVLAWYYWKIIRGYVVLSSSLTEFLKRDSFIWSDNATQTFNNLKVALTSALLLHYMITLFPLLLRLGVANGWIGSI